MKCNGNAASIYELLDSSQIRFLNDANRFRSRFFHLKVLSIEY